MAKKMSNKARIQQKAEEAAAADDVKKAKPAKKKKAKKKATRKKATKAAVRQKMVWIVFDANYREVATFPYMEKTKAYTTAKDLTKKKNTQHFVNAVKVPMDEE